LFVFSIFSGFTVNSEASEPSEPIYQITCIVLLNGFPLPIVDRGSAINRKSEAIAKYAQEFIGVPYVWGGTSPSGFDCSGFTYYIYDYFGINIPRTADDQCYYGIEVEKAIPGDLVFFSTYLPGPSHVGIYIGDNKFVHSSSSGVTTSSLFQSYYSERYLGTYRIL